MSPPKDFATPTAAAAPQAVNVVPKIFPIVLAVFASFMAIGIALPVLPLHVHGHLGLSTFMVGVVAGAQFVAALLTRAWAGGLCDTRGSKLAVMSGFVLAFAASMVYMASLTVASQPATSVAVLIAGRVLLGCAESLIVTGALSWGVGLVGPQNAGKVMAWVGIAMYGAYAAGAPAGMAVYHQYGFQGIAAAGMLAPALALLLLANIQGLPAATMRRIPFYKVLGAVWMPGLGLAFSSVGFGVITAFISLLFAAKEWGSPSLAFTAFGAAFIGARLLFGHLPDKIGGARVALVCVLIEALGQLCIWQASAPALVYVGAALTGFGYSLAFPGFGVEAVKRTPPQSRGAAMGAYVAFLDISLGLTGPLAGALAGEHGVGSVYLAGCAAVSCALVIAIRLLQPPRAA
ncbi:arabinose transporter [Pseudoduganella violaceinigra]|uniref:arabinose transporter n=1 Tax=Pseudoduganella violaceinigra TaxID=246602 RepID=UPI00040F7CC2|nr:arabinose transporter [Pseudoduganella violaceinigra]